MKNLFYVLQIVAKNPNINCLVCHGSPWETGDGRFQIFHTGFDGTCMETVLCTEGEVKDLEISYSVSPDDLDPASEGWWLLPIDFVERSKKDLVDWINIYLPENWKVK